MIRYTSFDEAGLREASGADGLPASSIWLDLLDPTPDEIRALERATGIDLPSRADMAEIEISSRLYAEDGALYMTALVPARAEIEDMQVEPVTFVLTRSALVTIRYHDPRVFEVFMQRAQKNMLDLADGEGALLELLDTIVDRLADILEGIGRELDAISGDIFVRGGVNARSAAAYKTALARIGRMGDMTSKTRDSLVTLERLTSFLGLRLERGGKRREALKTVGRDIRSLLDQSGFLSQKVTFLLDGMLGLINIEQNAIIKIFSVAAVIFLPPTLVASIYGMNFEHMPELTWPLGYPIAIGLMILSALVPYLFFKRRGWL